eukprot:11303109-Ditylum_brightwellii.AAC.1
MARGKIKAEDKYTMDLIPAGKAYLVINNKVITHKIPQAIHDAINLPNLKTFVTEKQKWSPET